MFLVLPSLRVLLKIFLCFLKHFKGSFRAIKGWVLIAVRVEHWNALKRFFENWFFFEFWKFWKKSDFWIFDFGFWRKKFFWFNSPTVSFKSNWAFEPYVDMAWLDFGLNWASGDFEKLLDFFDFVDCVNFWLERIIRRV